MKRRLTIITLCLACITLLTACVPKWVWMYYDEPGIWKTDDGSIILDCLHYTGILILDGEVYELELGFDPSAADIGIEKRIPVASRGIYSTDELTIWEADTKTDKDAKKLYLTVTKDNVSDCVGKTYVLTLYPDETFSSAIASAAITSGANSN